MGSVAPDNIGLGLVGEELGLQQDAGLAKDTTLMFNDRAGLELVRRLHGILGTLILNRLELEAAYTYGFTF